MNALVTRNDWAARISATWRQSVEAVIETGRLIAQAKTALPHGEFLIMVDTELPFGARTAQRLMQIAADTRLSNATHVSHLPASWGTLYEITKLDDDEFDRGIEDGTIRPDMARRELAPPAAPAEDDDAEIELESPAAPVEPSAAPVMPNGARSIMSSRQEPDDSLDYFPTPPWGTRAFIDHVLPALGVFKVDDAWEPACGEGHMAEVLRERFKTVLASDVFDYGYGDTFDFLSGDPKTFDRVDWIITNPPFDDKAIDFVLRGLEVANCGVAMFVRWQWCESVGRYERLFKPHPPTIVAPFVERINLCKGRWEYDGSTATAYCWIVWMPHRVPKGPTRLFWIPPGCRERCSRPDDVERFTAHPVIKRIEPEAQRDDTALAAAPVESPPTNSSAWQSPLADDPFDIPAFLRREAPQAAE